MEKPYFGRDETRHLISELTDLLDVTFYVGAGASIERTGLTWEGLSAQLLVDHTWGNFTSRARLAKDAGALTVSSAAEEKFREAHGANWRDRLRQHVADELYRGSDFTDAQGGYPRNTNIDGFYDSLIALSCRIVDNGGRVTIVTPNYDDFLIESLEALTFVDPEWVNQRKINIFGFGVDQSGQSIGLQKAALTSSIRSRGALTVIFLHGYAPRPSDREASYQRKTQLNNLDRVRSDTSQLSGCYPVVSEQDYAATRGVSRDVLVRAFRNRNVVMMGTSVNDVPLVDALLQTKDSSDVNRYAILPLHFDLGLHNRSEVEDLRRLRLKHLGVRYVSPDYFYQSRQIIEEWVAALALQSQLPYDDVRSVHRYGTRLNDWWSGWMSANPEATADRQYKDYVLLRDKMLPYVRDLLGSGSRHESLRIEVWLRWQPELRELRLWSSSAGDWPDVATMRRDAISVSSKYSTTQAFVNGAVTYQQSDDSRWSSFLALPIRISDHDTGAGIQVGAVGISSMNEPENSAINSAKKAQKMQLLRALTVTGSVIADPNLWDVLRS